MKLQRDIIQQIGYNTSLYFFADFSKLKIQVKKCKIITGLTNCCAKRSYVVGFWYPKKGKNFKLFWWQLFSCNMTKKCKADHNMDQRIKRSEQVSEVKDVHHNKVSFQCTLTLNHVIAKKLN
jgi:hypothetical protein